MTPSTIETYARNKLNALNDSLWSSAEIIENYLYECCMEFSREVKCIENTYTTTTVASTQEYALPSRYIDILRVTYNGTKLQPISMREYDELTWPNTTTTTSGTPTFYYYFGETIGLFPVPDAAVTLKIWVIQGHDVVSSNSTLEIPIQYHHMLVDGVVSKMCMKEIGDPRATFYAGVWQQHLMKAAAQWRKHKRGDRFGVVLTEERTPTTNFGTI